MSKSRIDLAKASGTEVETTKRRLISVSDWGRYHPYPPEGGLRHLIFHAATNGFGQVIRRIGRRILIDEQAFFEWVDLQNDRGAK